MTVWFINDTAYFANNFCVNKEKKELQCHGRCHLAKQISQTESQDNNIQVSILEFEFTQSKRIIVLTMSLKTTVGTPNFYTQLETCPGFYSKDTPPPNA